MNKKNYEAGRSSSATHRLTQASMTLDRRYVHRPGNLAIEEAAAEAQKAATKKSAQSAPSRLVNLGVHRTELEAAQRAQLEEQVQIQTSSKPKNETKIKKGLAPKPIAIFSNVVEMGGEDNQSENIEIEFSSGKKASSIEEAFGVENNNSNDNMMSGISPIALTSPSLTAPLVPETVPSTMNSGELQDDRLETDTAHMTSEPEPSYPTFSENVQTNDTFNAQCSTMPENGNQYTSPAAMSYGSAPREAMATEDLSIDYAAAEPANYPYAYENSADNVDTKGFSDYYAPENTANIAAANEAMDANPLTANNSESTNTSFSAPIDHSALAMNIAADYAAASLGASVAEYGSNYQEYAMDKPDASQPADLNLAIDRAHHSPSSVEEIARTAAEAIAAIHLATDPDDIAEQITSLKALAEKIREESSAPEIKELSDTIDKFVNVAMKSTGVKEAMERKEEAQRAEESAVAIKSTKPAKTAAKANTITLSRGATRAAARVTKSSAKAMAASRAGTMQPKRTVNNVSPRTVKSRVQPAAAQAIQKTNSAASKPRAIQPANKRSASQKITNNHDRTMLRAMRSVATMNDSPTDSTRSKKKREVVRTHKKSGGKRFLIAFGCATACVGAFFYFISSNMPDISVRVAALQTGIEAAYPSYIPRGYSLGDVASEDGKIGMKFNGPDGASFTLVEEKSSWDSAALERNLVKPTWSDKYSTTHEQGITIYICGSDAAWVNGGILYRISSTNDNLTKKQLRNIVVSL